MVFNVSLGFQNLQLETNNPKTQNYSLMLVDTVVIKYKGVKIMTGVRSKVYTDVAYSFKMFEEEDEYVDEEVLAERMSVALRGIETHTEDGEANTEVSIMVKKCRQCHGEDNLVAKEYILKHQ
eukprot:Gb_26086 [translate_table: standard]